MFFVKNSGLCSAQPGHLGLANNELCIFNRTENFTQVSDTIWLHHGKGSFVVVLNVQPCLFISILCIMDSDG